MLRHSVIQLMMVSITVLVSAEATAPNYHSTCCRPLPPEKVSKIPAEIRHRLTDEGCLIPQNPNVLDDPQPNNAIRGAYARKDQLDWAVLCIKPDKLLVRIFWGGNAHCDDEITVARYRPNDGHWDDPETFLWPADAKTIRAYNDAFGRKKLPLLDHSGLEVGGGEASEIHYCLGGQWVKFVGND